VSVCSSVYFVCFCTKCTNYIIIIIPRNKQLGLRKKSIKDNVLNLDVGCPGNAEIAGLDIVGLDIDRRMCGQLTELNLQNFTS